MATRIKDKQSATIRVFEAVFEDGVLKPLQKPRLGRAPPVLRSGPGAGWRRFRLRELAAWHEVYEGLSEDEVEEVEAMALDRSRFSREDPEWTGPRCSADTDILSEVIKRRDVNVQRHAQVYLADHGQLQFSIITRYEILRGLKAKDAFQQVLAFDRQCS